MFSLKDALKKPEKEVIEVETDYSGMPKDAFTKKDVIDFWVAFLEKLKEKRDHVSHSVLKTIVVKVTDHQIILEYESETVLGQFELHREKFMTRLREKLNNYHVKLNLIASNKPIKNRVKTKKDILEMLIKKNPEIGKLAQDLDFDVYG